jgi:hypothetical protein
MLKPGEDVYTGTFTKMLELNSNNYWKCASFQIISGHQGIFSVKGDVRENQHITEEANGCSVGEYQPHCRWQFVKSHIEGYYKIMLSGTDFGLLASLREWGYVELSTRCNQVYAEESCLWKVVQGDWTYYQGVKIASCQYMSHVYRPSYYKYFNISPKSNCGNHPLVKQWNIEGYNHAAKKYFWWTFPENYDVQMSARRYSLTQNLIVPGLEAALKILGDSMNIESDSVVPFTRYT